MINENSQQPRNSKNQWHGYHHWMYDGKLWFRTMYYKSKESGYSENHQHNETQFFII